MDQATAAFFKPIIRITPYGECVYIALIPSGGADRGAGSTDGTDCGAGD